MPHQDLPLDSESAAASLSPSGHPSSLLLGEWVVQSFAQAPSHISRYNTPRAPTLSMFTRSSLQPHQPPDPSMPSPEQDYLDLMQAGARATEDAATKLFDELKAIAPSFLMGEWEGGEIDTGHPAVEASKSTG
ncbi:hypothetical protein DFH09DRAFT_1092632 [Mycena vulgaris]|nr:hypothetical protein DFH09DRAFT_1092632 [Mycena vulgaris]